jgi:hypothetical protein
MRLQNVHSRPGPHCCSRPDMTLKRDFVAAPIILAGGCPLRLSRNGGRFTRVGFGHDLPVIEQRNKTDAPKGVSDEYR